MTSIQPLAFATVLAALSLSGCGTLTETSQTPATPESVVTHYADLALANYQDALTTAKALDQAVDTLLENPTEQTLTNAKQAWLVARVPYQQSEVFRFGNVVVDDWEGQLNAWPLDEGLIDYVQTANYQYELGNEGASANLVANNRLTIGGQTLTVNTFTPQVLADLNEIGGSEANVATGYHAIEFLLWGQDLNGFDRGNGNRPVTDYAAGNDCTNGNCDRRRAYLDAATDLLVEDLEWMTGQWSAGVNDNYRSTLLAEDASLGLQKMLFGMGSLSLGELAGERMKVALEANSPEDEHDCFSDNTHNSHFYNGQGVVNVYTGNYQASNGKRIQGPSLSDLVAADQPELDVALRQQLNESMAALGAIKAAAEASANPMAFDQMIEPGNQAGSTLINTAIQKLVTQTYSIEQVAMSVGVENLQPDDAGHAF